MMGEPVPRTAPARSPGRYEYLADLFAAAKAGDLGAIGELVTELSPLLWHVARAAGLNAADAEDVAQDVWESLLLHLDGIHSPVALTAWLYKATRRRAWRLSDAGHRQVPADPDWLVAVPDSQPSGEEQAIIDDQRRQLWRALSTLDARCQALLRVVAFVPRPVYDVVAAELGIPRGSLGPTRGRCLAKLRAVLQGHEEGTA
jgi:RNA polymerase sigma factor (sigma-70 family)